MKYVASNYGSIGTLDAAILSSDTEFDVTGSSAKLANLASGEGYLLCLGDPAGTREFIRCSTFSSNHFAGVTRGFESAKNGGIARGWPSGTPVTMIISAAYLDNIVQKGWDDFPAGYMQPFIESVMGLNISDWLTAHPKWSRIIDVPFIDLAGTIPGTDLLGRAMAVASVTHGPMDREGSDDAIIPNHTHPYQDAYFIEATTGVPIDGYINLGSAIYSGSHSTDNDNDTLYYRNATTSNPTGGTSVTDANIQRTIYLDWIIKVLD